MQLIMQAAAMGQGGEIFVLDMGQPIRIYDLAVDLIRLSGFEPFQDIEIKVTGLRPGEKLHEELFTASERRIATRNSRIFVSSLQPCREGELEDGLRGLAGLVSAGKYEDMALRAAIRRLVPEFSGVGMASASVKTAQRGVVKGS